MVPAASLTDVVRAASVGVRGGPAEAGELARDGDRDDRAALATLAVQSAPCAVQALLCLPADRDDVRGLPGLAALERLALRGGAAVVPRGFDQSRRPWPEPVFVIEPCRRVCRCCPPMGRGRGSS